ncbi:MAG: flippase-like domain-containing protein [Muribaculaceae bacterium]|nr:flippase-like domain-containing protein [Muribaculaceae bacterium]
MKKAISYLIKYGIPLVIGVGLMYFLYKNVDVTTMMQTLQTDVDYWWFIPVAVVSILSHVFRAMRWRLQLNAIDVKPSFSAVLNSIFGTYAVNLVFPRLGEVWRCGYIANRQKASVTQVMGSMVADRLTDTVTVLLLTLVTFLLAQGDFAKFFDAYPQMKENFLNVASDGRIWMGTAVAIIAIGWLLVMKTENKIIKKIQLMARNLWEGFAAITRMDGKWWFLLLTILIWGCYFLQLYLACKAFNFTCGLSVLAVLVMFVLSSIGMGVPTNGGLGSWHLAIIFGLSLYGVGVFSASNPDPRASAFAMLVWGFQTLLLIVLGIYAFISMAIDRKRIESGKTVVDTTNDEIKL